MSLPAFNQRYMDYCHQSHIYNFTCAHAQIIHQVFKMEIVHWIYKIHLLFLPWTGYLESKNIMGIYTSLAFNNI